jgi:hypothetical protein
MFFLFVTDLPSNENKVPLTKKKVLSVTFSSIYILQLVLFLCTRVKMSALQNIVPGYQSAMEFATDPSIEARW